MADLSSKYCDEAYSRSEVQLPDGNKIAVITVGRIKDHKPVVLQFGPLVMDLSEDHALEFADHLIRTVHHRRAVIGALAIPEAGSAA